ncbi:MAG: ATP synthase subunit I [Burkholderiales bacterium]|nr:ATP synthase subunit I [Burkholderiales bacterium]
MAKAVPFSTRPVRRVLCWQAGVTAGLAGAAWGWAGNDAALSALWGGVVNMVAVVVYAALLAISNPATAGATVAALLRAEAGKILVIVAQLWLLLTTYKEINAPAFFSTFVITVLLFRMALKERN